MTPIDQGIDCRRRLKKPRNRLRLERKWIYAEAGELYHLLLLEVPDECPSSCYTWRHVRGAGILAEEVGKAVWFRAPIDNEDCSGTAVINVYCAGHLLDTAYISTSTYPTPPDVLRWYEANRTYPTPPLDYWKYRAYIVKSTTLHIAVIVDNKTRYVAAGKPTFPTTDNLFLVSRSYDCNGIYLQTLQFARYNAPITQALLEKWLKLYEDIPLVVDARTPFLKGEPVTLEEGAIIPFGWKPNGRRVTGLTVPYGTIWPPDWKKGDPLPHWECCPIPLLEQELL